MKTNNIKLLLTSTAFAVFGALALQACSSSDDSSTSSGGSSGTGGTSSTAGKGGATSGGSTGTAGTAGSGTAGSGTAGTTSQGGSSEGGETGGDVGGASEGGASAGDSPSVAQCTDFCTLEGTTCTFTGDASPDADTAVYADNADCMTACAGFALGNVGVFPLGDESGDSFACRWWHVNKAASDASLPPTHCPHTGLLSKAHIADTTATGPCSGPIPAAP
jgi:hypothetical protein